MANKAKIGIIGAGYIAEHHLKVLSDIKDAEVVAICNRGQERRKTVSEKYKIKFSYANFKDMFMNHDLDAAIICVSAHNMSKVISECMEFKIPLLVEKPISLDIKSARKLAEKAKRLKVPVMVGLNRRFISTIEKAKCIISKIGKIRGILVETPERISEIKKEYNFPEETIKGWMYANSIHCIDLLRFFGGDISNVKSIESKEGESYQSVVSFKSGLNGYFYSFWDAPGNWSAYIFVGNNKVTIKPLEKIYVESLNGKGKVFEISEIDKKYKPGFFKQDSYFIRNIVIKKESIRFPASSIYDNMKTMELIEKIRR